MTRKISAFGTMTGASVVPAADYFPIVDASVADASKNKRITIDETKVALGLSSYLPLAGGTMTGAITLSADPASSLQAATKQYVDGIAVNLGKRQSVRVATTANIVISTALNSGDVIDGVTLATSDLVLVKNQTTGAQNGIYVVDVSPVRSVEFDTYDEHPGSLIVVQEGTANAESVWLCTSNVGGTLNTTPIVFSQSSATSGALLASNNLSDLTNTATARSNLGVVTALSGLTDVNITEGVGINGYSLTWDNATSKWIAVLAAGSTYSAGTGITLTGTTFSVDGTIVGRLATANTWALAQTFTVAPVFTDASGTRTALGLGTAATSASTAFQAADAQLFSNIPQNSKSAAYTTVLTDGQKHIFHPSADTTARTFTIDSNANVAYPIGTAITFVNQNAAGVITIAITSDTMRLAGAGTTGSRTLAANGIATALKIATTEWIISGTGLT